MYRIYMLRTQTMHLNEIDFGKLTFRNEQRPWSIECTSTAYCSTMGDVLTVAMSANTLKKCTGFIHHTCGAQFQSSTV